MNRLPLAAVLLDVGGTLWPDTWPASDRDDTERIERLCVALPGLDIPGATALFERLREGTSALEGALEQDTAGIVAAALRQGGLPADAPARAAVAGAMCLPAAGRIALFPGAAELLAHLRARGLKTVVISNAVWRDAAAYRADFEAMGVSGQIDAIISSVDAGVRKPHPAIFAAALAAAGRASRAHAEETGSGGSSRGAGWPSRAHAEEMAALGSGMGAGCPPERCVMIGNSERNDILPALALGMRALRVAIEEPPPRSSAAHATVTSLGDELLQALAIR